MPPVHLLTRGTGALLPLLRSLGVAGRRAVILGGRVDTAVHRSRYAQAWIELDWAGPPEPLVQRLLEIGESAGRPVLLANDDAAVHFVATHRTELASAWKLTPNPTLDALRFATDKARFVGLLDELGLPAPRSWVLKRVEQDSHAALASLGFPLVLKPADSAFGLGIVMCQNPAELTEVLGALKESPRLTVAQEYVPGMDCCASILAMDGQIIASTSQRALVADCRFGAPAAEIMLEECPPLLTGVQKIVEHLRWSGVAHFDAVMDTRCGTPRLLECNARFWGSLLASTSAGVNFAELAVLAALRPIIPVDGFSRRRFHVAGLGLRRFLFPGKAVRLRWNETLLPYFVRDPLPEITARMRQLRGPRHPR